MSEDLRWIIDEQNEELQRLNRFALDHSTVHWPCEECGHARNALGCLWCERNELRVEIKHQQAEIEHQGAELERLRAELKSARERRGHWQDLSYCLMELVDVVAGNSTEHGEGVNEDTVKADTQVAIDRVVFLKAEVERLRAADSYYRDTIGKCNAHIQDQEAEIERLRAELASLLLKYKCKRCGRPIVPQGDWYCCRSTGGCGGEG